MLREIEIPNKVVLAVEFEPTFHYSPEEKDCPEHLEMDIDINDFFVMEWQEPVTSEKIHKFMNDANELITIGLNECMPNIHEEWKSNHE